VRKYFETTYYPDDKVNTHTQDYAIHTYAYDFARRLITWNNWQKTSTTRTATYATLTGKS
jgi:hypothetical protein